MYMYNVIYSCAGKAFFQQFWSLRILQKYSMKQEMFSTSMYYLSCCMHLSFKQTICTCRQCKTERFHCSVPNWWIWSDAGGQCGNIDAKSYPHKMGEIELLSWLQQMVVEVELPIYKQILHCLSMVWALCSPSRNAFHYGEYWNWFVIGDSTFNCCFSFPCSLHETWCFCSSINMQQCSWILNVISPSGMFSWSTSLLVLEWNSY